MQRCSAGVRLVGSFEVVLSFQVTLSPSAVRGLVFERRDGMTDGVRSLGYCDEDLPFGRRTRLGAACLGR